MEELRIELSNHEDHVDLEDHEDHEDHEGQEDHEGHEDGEDHEDGDELEEIKKAQRYSDEDLDVIFTRADVNADGLLSIYEIQKVVEIKPLKEVYDDPSALIIS